MSEWLRLARDAEGFMDLAVVRARFASHGSDALRADLADVPALVVQDMAVVPQASAGEEDSGLVYRRTVDDADGPTQRFATGDPARYRGKVAFLLKRPGNPFPHMITIGRAPNSDITVGLGTMSKVHAYFLKEADGWKLVDQRSTNGTFADEVRLVPGAKHEVTPGSTIRFGRELLVSYNTPEALLALARG